MRGRGFKYGFFTMMIFNGVFCFLKMLEITWFAELEVAMFLSIVMGISVFACYCIWNDGYFSLNENRKSLLICFALIGISNIAMGIGNFSRGYAFVDGRLTLQSINLFCGILMLVIFTALLCKKVKESRED